MQRSDVFADVEFPRFEIDGADDGVVGGDVEQVAGGVEVQRAGLMSVVEGFHRRRFDGRTAAVVVPESGEGWFGLDFGLE